MRISFGGSTGRSFTTEARSHGEDNDIEASSDETEISHTKTRRHKEPQQPMSVSLLLAGNDSESRLGSKCGQSGASGDMRHRRAINPLFLFSVPPCLRGELTPYHAHSITSRDCLQWIHRSATLVLQQAEIMGMNPRRVDIKDLSAKLLKARSKVDRRFD